MTRTRRNRFAAWWNGQFPFVRDGKTQSDSRGFRWYKRIMRRLRRRKDKMAFRQGREPENWKKEDMWWW
jgi:hypothetical protein